MVNLFVSGLEAALCPLDAPIEWNLLLLRRHRNWTQHVTVRRKVSLAVTANDLSANSLVYDFFEPIEFLFVTAKIRFNSFSGQSTSVGETIYRVDWLPSASLIKFIFCHWLQRGWDRGLHVATTHPIWWRLSRTSWKTSPWKTFPVMRPR